MRLSLLPLLACPAPAQGHLSCGGALQLAAPHGDGSAIDQVDAGTLRCAACGTEYPIVDSIPRLRPQVATDRRVSKTQQSFAWEWSRYPGSLPEDRPIFLEETQIPAEEWSGKRVLDGGCGMGRDASDSVTDAWGRVHGVPWLRVADSSLFPDAITAHGVTLPLRSRLFRTRSVTSAHHRPKSTKTCTAILLVAKPKCAQGCTK